MFFCVSFFLQRDEEKSLMVQLLELGLVETHVDNEKKSSGSPGGKNGWIFSGIKTREWVYDKSRQGEAYKSWGVCWSISQREC